jgi:hypothetical protein
MLAEASAKDDGEAGRVALPIKTTSEDVRKIVDYFKTKPTGATLEEARASLGGTAVDGRKMSAFRQWGVLTREGEKYNLTPRARDYSRRPETEVAFFQGILDGSPAYRSAIEWMYHQKFKAVTVNDVASHWHEHHRDTVGADTKDSTLRENAVTFFHLCQASGLGKLTIGRGGNPTRLEINRDALKRIVEAGPSAPPLAVQDESDVEAALEEESSANEAGAPGSEEQSGPDRDNGQAMAPPSRQSEPLRAFIAHGKNMAIVAQVQTMLNLADIESDVAEEEETAAIPVPEKVFSAMKRCRAGLSALALTRDTRLQTARTRSTRTSLSRSVRRSCCMTAASSCCGINASPSHRTSRVSTRVSLRATSFRSAKLCG